MKSAYQQALDNLDPAAKKAVEGVLGDWSVDDRLAPVVRNIKDETALSTADFASLLSSFAEELAILKEPVDCWQKACRKHKRTGREISSSRCPALLGRAKSLEEQARAIARASAGLLADCVVKRMLLNHSGASDVAIFGSSLYDAPLGRHDLVWATFDSHDSNRNPFQQLPATRLGIRTALGLGPLSNDESLILLHWNHASSGSPPLHRPTVADAENYEYYRPCSDAKALWGLTSPLPPNPDGIKPQPEVVLGDPTSKGLCLPFQVI